MIASSRGEIHLNLIRVLSRRFREARDLAAHFRGMARYRERQNDERQQGGDDERDRQDRRPGAFGAYAKEAPSLAQRWCQNFLRRRLETVVSSGAISSKPLAASRAGWLHPAVGFQRDSVRPVDPEFQRMTLRVLAIGGAIVAVGFTLLYFVFQSFAEKKEQSAPVGPIIAIAIFVLICCLILLLLSFPR